MTNKQYLKYGQTARDKIFGLPPDTRRNGPTPLSMLISHGAKFNNSKYSTSTYQFAYGLFYFRKPKLLLNAIAFIWQNDPLHFEAINFMTLKLIFCMNRIGFSTEEKTNKHLIHLTVEN